ncbi:SDR family NAD(P)-dependent oxidoreductase [Streptomyces sp. NPDC046261]|uniref:SDR family NAD(P)-dependent oxidoreductase n=1 Tax=Streptomyces sp. NPDC046261 TaxID=3157200 RepID=UPI0033FAFF51
MVCERTIDAGRAVAVVGVACRLPGSVTDLEGLWSALIEGRDLVGEVPGDRFDLDRFVDRSRPRRGKSYTAAGGLLDDITGFDPGYFGISGREAAHIDPQHRLLLELAAEALDDAAIAPATLAGTDTAVYVGLSDNSYGFIQLTSPRTVNAYSMVGGALSIAANRLSHAFDLRGPSMTIDTACSSSLVALDRACRTLRDGTSRTALCGGANVLLSPFPYVGFSQASMLSPRGRCAAFSADADGFVRAEGGAMVVLKTLRDALADGDRVHGVILGTATGSDGRTMGLSLPNPAAQEELLRRLYADTGVHPDELVYFEAHGTGTPAGDPAEAQSIGRALGSRRTVGPLPVGSVKSTLGHLEPASGMAGLCKALLVLAHRTAPASLHAQPPHPGIDFTGLGISPVTATRALPDRDRPVVGVNSFGFGGSNAHAVLTVAPPAPPRATLPDVPPEGLPVVVSARTPAALSEAAERMARRLAGATPEEFYDIAYTACVRRGGHEHRSAVLARTAEQAARWLARPAATDEVDPGDAVGATAEAVTGGRIAFVFSGNGSQWAGMGADLFAQDAVFRAAVAAADAELTPRLGWSVAELLAAPPGQWRLSATETAQPMLFAVQLGLVAVLRSRGVEPAMVLGHSVGEVAAAHAAGALGLDQAAQVIAERGLAQAATAGLGRMAAVGLPLEEAAEALAPYGPDLEIAGINSPRDVTVTGGSKALSSLAEQLRERGVPFHELRLDHPFHSRHMDDLRTRLLPALAGLAPVATNVPFLSTVTGAPAPGPELDAEYWWRNVRRPVLFSAAVEAALDQGADVFLEIGPHPVLGGYVRRTAGRRTRARFAALATLRRSADGPRALATASAALIAAGARVDWDHYFPSPGRVTRLPAYPWQRERHWNSVADGLPWITPCGTARLEHPLLGEKVSAPLPTWGGPIEPTLVPWLADHRLVGSVVMPSTGYVEMAMAAGRRVLGGPVEVEHLAISAPLIVDWDDPGAVRTQVCLRPDDGTVTVTSSGTAGGEARPHARARVRTLLRSRPAPLDPVALRARCPRRVEAPEIYRTCTEVGLAYGPAFRTLRGLWAGDGEVLAEYHHDAPGAPYTVHPALLDGALQSGVVMLASELAEGQGYLPTGFEAVRVWRTPSPSGLVRARERSRTRDTVCWDITVADEDGTVTVRLDGCRLRRLPLPRITPLTTLRTVTRAAPHPDAPRAASPLSPSGGPASPLIATAARERIAELGAAWGKVGHERLIRYGKEATARRYATVFAGLLPDPAAPFSVDDLVSGGLAPRYRRLARLALPLLARHGLAQAEGAGQWRLDPAGTTAPAPAPETTPPACVTEVALLEHLLRHLPAVLTGAEDAMGLLVSEPVARALEQFYDTAPVNRFHHRLMQALVSETVKAWPGDRALRVLEVGAGTGAATAALLPLLPADRTTYCFSDVSAAFLHRAQQRFAQHDVIDYRTLDLDTDPTAQGFTPHTFDLVVAANALHTAQDLHAALGHVTTLLGPGGMLLAYEFHDAEALLPYFGTLDSFYHNTDRTLRPDCVLLSRDRWPGVLESCGYTGVVRFGDERKALRDHASVFLATAPLRTATEPPAPPRARAGTFVIAAETPKEEAMAHAVAEALTAAGSAPVDTVTCSPQATPMNLTALSEQLTRRAPAAPGVLSVVLLLGEAELPAPGDLVTRTTDRASILRTIAGLRAHLAPGARTELWLVTRPCGAVPGPDPITHPADAAAWGTARCLRNEHSDMGNRRVALHRTGDATADARRLARELLAPGDEDELVLTAHDRFVPREKPHDPARTPATGTPYALRVRDPGLSYRLVWEEVEPPRPGPGEVVLQVRAAALNYRDIMDAVGLLPPEADEHGPPHRGLGLECAGVVTACGPGVQGLSPGDRVVAVAPDALASHTVTSARSVRPLPDGLSWTEAATLPIVFTTVHYGLHHLARLQPGETVLVHGAAGGVGLAALQYVTSRGAHLIATAGNELKRDFLRRLGVPHVLDSRTLAFAEDVRRITQGRGVDVVLNSLAGEAMTRSLELLRPGGRFVELGKRDLYEDRTLPLRPFGNNIAFTALNFNLLTEDPQRLEELLAEVDEHLRDGALRPLPHTVHPAARVTDAFRQMQHSRHLGKVVISFDPLDEPPLVHHLARPPRLREDATYLITGGTGGFGAVSADWLADLGARHLALVSRRGAHSPEAAGVRAALTARGVDAVAHAVDVTDPEAMRALVRRIDAGGHPVRGAVHCAMHLDDELLTELGPERFASVLAPKMAGAAVLEELTRDRPCDLFLLYSSATALVGNIKQAPYAAGNLYLEALARRRRQSGGSATAIAWGTIGGTGYAARTGSIPALAAIGLEALDPARALPPAARLLGERTDVAALLRCDWARLGALLPSLSAPRMRALVPERGASEGLSRVDLVRQLAGAGEAEARALIARHVKGLLAEVLGADPEQLDVNRRLDTFGVDSLMAAELLALLYRRYEVQIPPLELMHSNGTITDIADLVHQRLALTRGTQETASISDGG